MTSLAGHLSLPRRAGIVLRWPLGIARATWAYATRSVPIHRVEVEGDRSDLPWPLAAADGEVQGAEDGVGALLRRCYTVTVDDATQTATDLISGFGRTPNWGAPADIAMFVKTRGTDGVLVRGDEYSIRMPGPWNGPVRVVRTTPTSLRLATLDGHLEAGQIEFRAREQDGALVLEIESRARPGDLLGHVLYNVVGLAKEVQLTLWVETLLGLVGRSGGHLRDGVHVTTHKVAADVVAQRSMNPARGGQ